MCYVNYTFDVWIMQVFSTTEHRRPQEVQKLLRIDVCESRKLREILSLRSRISILNFLQKVIERVCIKFTIGFSVTSNIRFYHHGDLQLQASSLYGLRTFIAGDILNICWQINETNPFKQICLHDWFDNWMIDNWMIDNPIKTSLSVHAKQMHRKWKCTRFLWTNLTEREIKFIDQLSIVLIDSSSH